MNHNKRSKLTKTKVGSLRPQVTKRKKRYSSWNRKTNIIQMNQQQNNIDGISNEITKAFHKLHRFGGIRNKQTEAEHRKPEEKKRQLYQKKQRAIKSLRRLLRLQGNAKEVTCSGFGFPSGPRDDRKRHK